MPIVRNYSPQAGLLGAIAFQGGQGQFRQRQDQFQHGTAMDVARLSLAAQEADRRFFSNQQQRADQQAYVRQRAQQQAQQQAAAIAADQERQQRQFEQQAALQTQQQEGQRAYLDQQNQFLAGRDELGFRRNMAMQGFADEREIGKQQAQWDRDAAMATDAESRQLARDLRGMNLDPSAIGIRDSLVKEYESIRSQKLVLPPRAYAEVVSEWMKKASEAGLEDMAVKPPTAEEIVSQKSIIHPITGDLMGIDYRNGEPVLRVLKKKEEMNGTGSGEGGAGDEVPVPIKPDNRTWAEWREAAQSQLEAEAFARQPAAREGEPEPPPPPPPSNDEIKRRAFEMMQESTAVEAEFRSAAAAASGDAAAAEAPQEEPVAQQPDGSYRFAEWVPEEEIAVYVQEAPPGTVFVDPSGRKFMKPGASVGP